MHHPRASARNYARAGRAISAGSRLSTLWRQSQARRLPRRAESIHEAIPALRCCCCCCRAFCFSGADDDAAAIPIGRELFCVSVLQVSLRLWGFWCGMPGAGFGLACGCACFCFVRFSSFVGWRVGWWEGWRGVVCLGGRCCVIRIGGIVIDESARW